jgi:hypothetical protein
MCVVRSASIVATLVAVGVNGAVRAARSAPSQVLVKRASADERAGIRDPIRARVFLARMCSCRYAYRPPATAPLTADTTAPHTPLPVSNPNTPQVRAAVAAPARSRRGSYTRARCRASTRKITES